MNSKQDKAEATKTQEKSNTGPPESTLNTANLLLSVYYLYNLYISVH